MNLKRVHLERDAKIVVDDAVNSVDVDRRWMGHVVDDSKVKIEALIHWQIMFVKREGNQVAHILAKYAVKHVINNL
jgi:hypothetical protein